MFFVIFTALLIAEIKIMTKQIKKGPGEESHSTESAATKTNL
jgi:cytochrome bd-type quinol oxidase subunit 1